MTIREFFDMLTDQVNGLVADGKLDADIAAAGVRFNNDLANIFAQRRGDVVLDDEKNFGSGLSFTQGHAYVMAGANQLLAETGPSIQ